MNKSWKLGLGFALVGTLAACGGDEPNQQNGNESPSADATGVVAGDAVGGLLQVSGLTAGGVADAARAGLTEVEVAAYLGDLIGQLDNASCLDASVVGESAVRLNFDACRLGSDIVDGVLDVTLALKAASVALNFAGDLAIDGHGLEGTWSAQVDSTGAIQASGNVQYTHGSDLVDIDFDGSWSYSVGDFCPKIDLSLSAAAGSESINLDIQGLDVCIGVCAPGVLISLGEDVFTPADGGVMLDGTLLSCAGGDIDLDIVPENPEENPEDPNEDPEDPQEDPEEPANFSPRTGAWDYDAYTPITNNCDFADELDSANGFVLTNNEDGTFTVDPGSTPFDCTLDGNNYHCPNAHSETALIAGANLSAQGTASGVLLSDTSARGSRSITVNCSGPECAFVAAARGATFPCTFHVDYEVSFEAGL